MTTEADSTFGSDDDNLSMDYSTASLTASIFESHMFQGRAYANPKYGNHWAPNDEEQLDVLDVTHHWIQLSLEGKLHLPDIGENPQKILDIGTGTGIWAIDMGDAFPSASVIGIDITPSQPRWVPPNVEFQIHDAEDDWTFDEESFDFIHIRYLHGSIRDWEKLYKKWYRFLKPGGWFQHIEPDLYMDSENPEIEVDNNHVFTKWGDAFLNVGKEMGKTMDFSGRKLEELAKGADFSNIKYQTHKIPVGRWPKDQKKKELGAFVHFSMDQGIDGFVKRPLCEILKWSSEEMHMFAADMRKTLKDANMQTTGQLFSVYGQKPIHSAKTMGAE